MIYHWTKFQLADMKIALLPAAHSSKSLWTSVEKNPCCKAPIRAQREREVLVTLNYGLVEASVRFLSDPNQNS